jgi:OFA family oxalate/formate antiporter-like MFS transporter
VEVEFPQSAPRHNPHRALTLARPAYTLMAGKRPGAKLKNMESNRWRVALAGTLLQVCLGTVYAWSFFQKPVVAEFGCSQSQAAWAFSLAICFLGLAAAWGGLNLGRHGPARLAVAGGVLYGLGYLAAAGALAVGSRALFYLGFGVVGGIGLGLGYVTPVATAAKWFPDKKGLVTGLVVMGFGLGALVMSKVLAPVLMGWFGGSLVKVFSCLGLVLLAGTVGAGMFLQNPPPGFTPAGMPASSAGHAAGPDPGGHWEWLRSGKFARMWLVFFGNITAGIMFIGFQSPMVQELLKARQPGQTAAGLAAAGATLIGASSLFNGLGRLWWGGLSDRLGRARTFRIILGSQVVVLAGLPWVQSPWVFGALVCYILLCYGGGFGTMPSFVLEVYGARRMPVVYGAMLSAWSLAGILGPQLAALIKDHFPARASAFTFGAGAVILAAALLLAWGLDDQPPAPRANA